MKNLLLKVKVTRTVLILNCIKRLAVKSGLSKCHKMVVTALKKSFQNARYRELIDGNYMSFIDNKLKKE